MYKTSKQRCPVDLYVFIIIINSALQPNKVHNYIPE